MYYIYNINMKNMKNTTKINFDKVLNFYQTSTPEEICQLLTMVSDRIMVPVQKDGFVDCQELDKEVPVVMNGPFYQINTEELYIKEK